MSQKPTIAIVMGVSGCGKSTVGQALAEALHWQFEDADSFHPPANKEKMRTGVPLNDLDREPWLHLLRDQIDGWLKSNQSAVLACSALKEKYRTILREKDRSSKVCFIYLKAERQVLETRLRARSHEYMNPALLDSQLTTLEEPVDAIVQNAQLPLEVIIEELRHNFQ